MHMHGDHSSRRSSYHVIARDCRASEPVFQEMASLDFFQISFARITKLNDSKKSQHIGPCPSFVDFQMRRNSKHDECPSDLLFPLSRFDLGLQIWRVFIRRYR
jgi:hypothetical protein